MQGGILNPVYNTMLCTFNEWSESMPAN